MNYHSTRDKNAQVSAAQAIVMGLSPDGGLFVPKPSQGLAGMELEGLVNMNYNERVADILKRFLTDFRPEEIRECVNRAYNKEKFETDSIAPCISYQTACIF